MADEVGKVFLSLELKNNTEKGMDTMASDAEKKASDAFSEVGSTAARAIVGRMQYVGKGIVDIIKRAGAAIPSIKPVAPSPKPLPAMKKADTPAFTTSSDGVELLNQKLDVTYAKLGEQQRKLESLMAEYQKLSALGVSNSILDDLDKQITDTQSRMISLQGTINSTVAKIKAASEGSAQSISKDSKKGQSSFGKAAKTMGTTLSSAFKKGGAAAGSAMKNIQNKASGLSRSVKSAFKSAFLMAGLYAAFRGIRSLMGEAANQNTEFSNSLQTIKTNLTAAFVPIANAAMPYINMLMSGITSLSAKLVSTTANMFGTTVAQSTAAAKKLQSATAAAKKSATATASIDQLNVISQNEDPAAAATSAGTAAVATGKQITGMLSSLAGKVGPFLANVAMKIATATPAIISAGATIIISLLNGVNQSFPQFSTAGISILQTLLEGMWQIVPQIGPLAVNIVTLLLTGFLTYIPQLLTMGVTVLASFLTGMVSQMPMLISTAQDSIQTILTTLLQNLPSILQSGITILLSLANGIVEMLPELLVVATQIILSLISGLVNNLPAIIKTAIDLILALVYGILDALPIIIAQGVEIIDSLITGLVEAIPLLVDAAIEIIMALVDFLLDDPMIFINAAIDIVKGLAQGLVSGAVELVKAVPKVISTFVNKIFETDWLAVGKKIIGGIWNGIKSRASSLGDIFAGLFGGGTQDAVSVPKFASGGIVSGPTLAMIGEYSGARSDPEVVTPLSRLKAMIGTGQVTADSNILMQILSLLQRIEQSLSDSNLGEVAALLLAILRWLEDQDFDIALFANDREIARSANRGNKSLGIAIAE